MGVGQLKTPIGQDGVICVYKVDIYSMVSGFSVGMTVK